MIFVLDESKIVNGTYKGVMQVFSYDNVNEIELPWSGEFLVLLRNQFGALPVVDYFEGNRYKLNEAIYHYRGSNVLEFIKVGGTRKTMVLVPLSVQVSAYNMENDGIKGAYIPELEKEIQKVLEVIRNSGTNVTNKEKAFLNNLKFIEKELTGKTNVVFGKVEEVLNEVALVEQESERFLSLVRENERLVDEKYHKFDTDITEANQTIDDILALQPQFQAVLDETTGKDVISAPEIILARNGEANLKARLDKEQQQVTAQLAQIGTQVTNFNPIGDGITDDSIPLQNAINYAITNEKPLMIRGKYRIKTTLLIEGNLRIFGDGNTEIIIDSSLNNGINVTGEGVLIDGITFTEEVYNDYSTIEVSANNCKITNCTFNGNKVNGILIKEGIFGTTITNNHFKDYFYMVCCEGSLNNIISNNFFTGGAGSGGNGIKLKSASLAGSTGSHRNLITGNIFDGCLDDCIDTFTDGSESVITDNVFRNWGLLAVEVKTIYRDSEGNSVEGTRQNKNFIISNNLFLDSLGERPLSAIRITNIEERSGYTTDPEKGVHGVTVIGNIFKNINYGIELRGSKSITISNNRFSEIQERNINMTGYCAYINIESNFIEGIAGQILISMGSNTHENVSIKNNKFKGSDTTTSIGIDAYGSKVQISGNNFNTFYQGIKAPHLDNSTISDNIIDNCSHSCINFGSSGNSVLLFNNFLMNSPRGIVLTLGISNIISNGNVFKEVTTPTVNSTAPTNYQEFNNVTI